MHILFSEKVKKTAKYSREFNNYKKSLKRNSNDHALLSQFIKFCLKNHFILEDMPEAHLNEALELFKKMEQSDYFDPQVFYLVGRYYQGKDDLKAQNAYLSGIRSFNRYIEKNPGLKSDHVELAYALALNFLNFQFGQIHPDLEIFFKTVRKSYPVLNKRVELENELMKSKPDQDRVKQLSKELKELREITSKSRPKLASKN